MNYIFIAFAKQAKRILLTLAIFLLLSTAYTYAQNPASYYSPGVKFLTDAQYAQLPRPNWDTLSKYAPGRGGSSTDKLSGLTMLVNPPIGDQGTQGSCVGWASGYSAMGILTYAKYNCWNVAARSPNYVYNQIKLSADCLSGSYVTNALDLLVNQGDCSQNLMPYVNNDCATQPSTAQRNEAAQNKATKWAAFNKNDYVGMKKAIDMGYPVVIAFQVTTSFDNMWNNGGIWTTNTGTSRGGHATCIVGYDDSKGMFKVQNQWGLGGDHGFFWVTYNLVSNNCLQEAYLLYGVNNKTPMSIDGSNPLCSSGSYSVLNMPTGSSVTWSSTGPVTGGAAGNPTTFTKSGAGQATLTALVNTCSNTQTLNTTITTGSTPVLYATYTVSGTNYPLAINPQSTADYNQVCSGPTVTVNVTADPGVTVTWSKLSQGPGVVNWSQSGNNLTFYFYSTTQYALFQVVESSACGTSTTKVGFKATTCTGGGGGCSKYIITPNPAHGKIIINKPQVPPPCGRISDADWSLYGIQKVNIYDNTGMLKLSKTVGSAQQLLLDVSTLHVGYYMVEIVSQAGTEKQKVLID